MTSWRKPFNYIAHLEFYKVKSVTTSLRVVSNSSISNNSGWSYNSIHPKGPNSSVPLISAIVSWRSYEHMVVWDLEKAYSMVHNDDEELHIRKMVWRWEKKEDKFQTYGFQRMHFGDRPAMCSLEVAKWRLAELRQD